MDLRTYRAATMNEALALVRRELGPDAAVLHTREVRRARLFGLLAGQRMIEVTASRDLNVPSRIAIKESISAGSAECPAKSAYPPPWLAAPAASARSPQQATFPIQVQKQLTDLQTMLNELCQRSKNDKFADLPEALLQLYAKLVDADLSADLDITCCIVKIADRLRKLAEASEKMEKYDRELIQLQ